MSGALRGAASPRLLAGYGAVCVFLAALGSWLVLDFLTERDRLLAASARLAIHKSQFMNRAFGDTFLAADYVLRDVIGHTDLKFDLAYPNPDPARVRRMGELLREKVATVSGLTDLVVLNGDCVFVAVARNKFAGTRSNQSFCSEPQVPPGQTLRIQYMPPEKSASGRPVVLMSRIVGSGDGRLLGAAMAVIGLDHAQRWIESFEIDTDDALAIVDTDATLLARNPPLIEALGKKAPLPGPLFADVGAGSTFTTASPYDGRQRVFGVSRLEHFPFVAVVGFDRTRLLAGWSHRAWEFAAGFAALLALFVAVLRAHLIVVRQREDMHRLAITDAMTGLTNRSHLLEIGQREVVLARRHDRPLSLLMLDLDRFKSVNETWGHATGDEVLRKMAGLIAAIARTPDMSGRLGGEEFALLLPETGLDGARAIAERLRAAAEEAQTTAVGADGSVRFTVSIGAASLTPDDESFDTLLQRGDLALFLAKEDGRNCVVAL